MERKGAIYLRGEAMRLRRLTHDLNDDSAGKVLGEMADEYEAKAKQVEAAPVVSHSPSPP
jgi:hypothetical protein